MKNSMSIVLVIFAFLITGCVSPVANNDNVKIHVGESIVIDILDNDENSATEGGVIDPTTVVIVSHVVHGSVSVNKDNGSVTYVSDGVYTGIETFTYKVRDSRGFFSNIATVTIDILGTILVKKDTNDTKATEWYIRIIAEDTTNNMKTAATQLGQLNSASAPIEHSLKAIAPFTSPYLDVVFLNPPNIDAGEYKSNFHISSTDADSWEFTVKASDSHADMILSWRGLYVLSSYLDNEGRTRYKEYRSLRNPLLAYMTLLDVDKNIEMNVLENNAVNAYVFNMDGATERTFRWILQDSALPLVAKQSKIEVKQNEVFKQLKINALRKDAKSKPSLLKEKRLHSFDMMTPPKFEVLVK